MDLNDELFQRAQISIPGGVNSPVRAFRSVGGSPRFIDRAKGPYMWDATGKQFIDYILSWGPMILGHNNDEVIAAVDEAVSKGLSFGAVTQGETLIAEEVRKLLNDSYDQAKKILTENRGLLDEVALYLLQKETITGDELMQYVDADKRLRGSKQETLPEAEA